MATTSAHTIKKNFSFTSKVEHEFTFLNRVGSSLVYAFNTSIIMVMFVAPVDAVYTNWTYHFFT
jgi:hypothetical protein